MGMTQHQLLLIRAVAENRLQEAKKYAIACCDEDTTQKNKWTVSKYKSMLKATSLSMIELPPRVTIKIPEFYQNVEIFERIITKQHWKLK